MTDWTARIDALLAKKPDPRRYVDFSHDHLYDLADWLEARLALAAERMKAGHASHCIIEPCIGSDCTCGKDSDLLRILEGK